MTGLFLTFEGIDASGKTTQAKLLVKRLEELGYPLVFLREPGGTEISERIREILLDRNHFAMQPRSELFLYSAARAQVVDEVIKPALAAGKVVIGDRYADSTVAYQGYGRGLDLAMILTINAIATDRLQPTLTFLIDVPPEIADQRRQKASIAMDRLEGERVDFHNRVRKGYFEIAEKDKGRFRVVDGMIPPEVIHDKIWAWVFPHLSVVSKAMENG